MLNQGPVAVEAPSNPFLAASELPRSSAERVVPEVMPASMELDGNGPGSAVPKADGVEFVHDVDDPMPGGMDLDILIEVKPCVATGKSANVTDSEALPLVEVDGEATANQPREVEP